MKRVLIVFNGGVWYVRRVRVVEHDMTNDEQVYRCDDAIANNLATPEEALVEAKKWLKK